MFQGTPARVVPNQFIKQDDPQYVKSQKVKSYVKGASPKPLHDKTNQLPSFMHQSPPQKLQLEGYEPEPDQTIDQEDDRLFEIMSQAKQNFVRDGKSNKVPSSKQIKCQKYQLSYQKDQGRGERKIEPDLSFEWKQNRKNSSEPFSRTNQDRRVFDIDLTESSDEETEGQLTHRQNTEQSASYIAQPNQKNKHKKQEQHSPSQIKNLFTYIPSKCTNIDLSDSSDSSNQIRQSNNEENLFKQEESIFSKQIPSQIKKTIFDSQDLESESDQAETVHNQIDEKQVEEYLTIVKRINIDKFKQVNASMNSMQLLIRAPIPEEHKISLIIKRDSDKGQYNIYDSELIYLVMRVEKKIGGAYHFWESKHFSSTGKEREVGKMKANFIGTQFDCYFTQKYEAFKIRKRCLSVKYQVNFLGLNGPRKVSLIAPDPNWPVRTEHTLLQLYEKAKEKKDSGLKRYQSKKPKWVAELNAYVLNMRGTAVHSSIKNCIVADIENPSKQFLIFGKKTKDVFNLDIKHPFTIFQGIAFAVSSFEKKLACE